MEKITTKTALIALVLSISVSTPIFAATNSTTEKSNQTQQTQKHNGKGNKHSFYESSQVLKKLKLTEKEVVDARKDGKSFFDLTKSKGFTEEQVKKIIIQETLNSLNTEVEKGKLTKEKATDILNKRTAEIQGWDGNLNIDNREKKHFNILQKLGITEQDISDAKKDGKTFFDLAKAKGYSEKEVKNLLIQEGTAEINKAVEEGKITKDKADTIISEMKNKVQFWDGTFKSAKES